MPRLGMSAQIRTHVLLCKYLAFALGYSFVVKEPAAHYMPPAVQNLRFRTCGSKNSLNGADSAYTMWIRHCGLDPQSLVGWWLNLSMDCGASPQ